MAAASGVRLRFLIVSLTVVVAIAAVMLSGLFATGQSASSGDVQKAPAALVAEIMRADYEGDRAALARLHGELAVSQQSPRETARTRYWRGYALWRRVVNGYVGGADRRELVADLESALPEFEQALASDPSMDDAKAGLMACAGLLAGLSNGNAERVAALSARYGALVSELTSTASENPRVLWVVGLRQWSAPSGAPRAQVLERQARAMATYERGLALARKQANGPNDPMEPAWGEPELLMSLAWSHLNKDVPDAAAAERYAKEALAIVPYWHYLRDILTPQIRKAMPPADRE